jgi:acyl-CoA thioester hydrolase
MRFFETTHGVYFDDLDAFRILHNARYLVMFERTVGAFWEHLGWPGGLELASNPDGYHLVRANQIDYLKPVDGVGQVRVRTWVSRLGRSSVVFAFRMLPMDQDVDHARGTRVLVKVDPKTQRPAPWSDAFREKIGPYVQDAEEAGDPKIDRA